MKNKILQEFKELPSLGKAMLAASIYFILMTAFLWVCIATGNYPLTF